MIMMTPAGDLNASEISMSEEDRIHLMILVKEGRITMHQAVDAVCHSLYGPFPLAIVHVTCLEHTSCFYLCSQVKQYEQEQRCNRMSSKRGSDPASVLVRWS